MDQNNEIRKYEHELEFCGPSVEPKLSIMIEEESECRYLPVQEADRSLCVLSFPAYYTPRLEIRTPYYLHCFFYVQQLLQCSSIPYAILQSLEVKTALLNVSIHILFSPFIKSNLYHYLNPQLYRLSPQISLSLQFIPSPHHLHLTNPTIHPEPIRPTFNNTHSMQGLPPPTPCAHQTVITTTNR